MPEGIVPIIIDFDGHEYHETYAHVLVIHFVVDTQLHEDHAGPILEDDFGYVGAYQISMS